MTLSFLYLRSGGSSACCLEASEASMARTSRSRPSATNSRCFAARSSDRSSNPPTRAVLAVLSRALPRLALVSLPCDARHDPAVAPAPGDPQVDAALPAESKIDGEWAGGSARRSASGAGLMAAERGCEGACPGWSGGGVEGDLLAGEVFEFSDQLTGSALGCRRSWKSTPRSV
jgi:hypothetical protein